MAARFLAIALGGVLMPLALVGVWLTRSAERAGTELLQGQLADASTVLGDRFARRWMLRDGELQLLAGNSSAVAIVRGLPVGPADSAYLYDLVRSLEPALTEVAYRDTAGRLRWSSAEEPVSRDWSNAPGVRAGGVASDRQFAVERPVLDGETPVGTVSARVRLAAVLPLDSASLTVPSGSITITADSLRVYSSAPDTVDVTAPAPPIGWAVERRTLALPQLTLVLAAPIAPFVAPFRRVTRLGLSVLTVVALVALVLTIVLTTRVTRSLERLADAAAAVAAGHLDRTVAIDGHDEIGRTAQAFNAMTESLRGTLADLARQRALAAVGEFAATLSHEVRNSLTAVRVDLQHALRHRPRTAPDGQLVGRALDSVHRLDATVTSALRMARGGTVPLVPVRLADVLERAAAVTAPVFAEREVTLRQAPAAESPMVLGDAAALEQLFINLLLNAAQAMAPGGEAVVRMHATVAPATAAPAATVDGAAPPVVAVHVTDNGPGLQAGRNASTDGWFQSTKPHGTGLGLPIARRIAEMHGGSLAITPGPGSGTEVIVALPTAQRTAEAGSGS